MIEPRVYIACLASYNNGILHGEWIDVPDTVEELQAEINKVLASSTIPSSEEWAVHDHEGFAGLITSEYPSLAHIVNAANMVNELGEDATMAACQCLGVDDALEAFGEGNLNVSEYGDKMDYADQLLEDCGYLAQIPDHLRFYFDTEAWFSDVEMEGSVNGCEINGNYYVVDAG